MLLIQLLNEDQRAATVRIRRNAYLRRWRAANPGKDAAYCRGYAQRHPEKEAARRVAYAKTHGAQSRAYSRQYRLDHLEEVNARYRAWSAANREMLLAHRKDQHLQALYGISLADFGSMLLKQAGVCGCCGEPPTTKRRFHVDHDHATGVVRALLCSHCNVGIAQFRDDPKRLQKAITYLRRFGK